jgi:hypothetical protein
MVSADRPGRRPDDARVVGDDNILAGPAIIQKGIRAAPASRGNREPLRPRGAKSRPAGRTQAESGFGEPLFLTLRQNLTSDLANATATRLPGKGV